MPTPTGSPSHRPSRRHFLQQTGSALTGAALVHTLQTRSYAAGSDLIRVALVGCGGRGTGAAANALSTAGPTQLWALADLFDHRLNSSLNQMTVRFADQVHVPGERQFLGFDAYQKAMDALNPGDVVLLATPPAFRPAHLDYAVDRGLHVFMEKSFAVDAPGVERVLQAGKRADEKNLKIAGGLMSRHYRPLEEAVAQLHAGAIGDLITCWAYREHGPVDLKPRSEGLSELAFQIQNYSCFTWANGSFLLDWLIHNLDVCCWCKDAWPVAAQGQGGRQVRAEPDQLFDHYAIEYRFADGTRLFAQGRHMANCWGFFGDEIHGTTGLAVLGEGITQPKIYRGHNAAPESLMWEYKGPPCDAYQHEHDLLFQAIREDLPHNETERCAYAAMTGILGRMAAESGQLITWDQARKSTLELAPGLEDWTWDSPPPVRPGENGKYPIAMPGFSKTL